MEKKLLNLVRQSIEEEYLPEHWHQHKHDVVNTTTGFLSLSTDCIRIDDDWYHEKQDEALFVFDEADKCYILAEDSITVCQGRDDYFYTSKQYRADYFEYNHTLYTKEGLEANELVFTVHDSIAHRDDVYYWESDDHYHFDPEYDDDEYYNRDIWGYHDGPCPPDYRDDKSEPGIGFEIEKGNDPIFCGYGDRYELFDQTGCVIEEDGSVDWELKTPVYPLFDKRVENYWLPDIEDAVNADDHKDAGGHIHLSMPPKTGQQLFDYCRPYLPLFMAMYPARLEKDYCKGKPEKQLKKDDEKHQAVKIWDNRIELRFPAKVYHMKALVFRLNFCRLMIERECSNILSVTLSAFDSTTKLNQLISQEYAGREHELLVRIANVAKRYFNTNLLNEKSIETLLSNLKTKKPCVLQS